MGEEKLELFVRKSSGLVRGVGIFTVIAICFAFTVPGIFFFPFAAEYYFPGSNPPLAWAIAPFLMVWSTVAIVFLTVAMPRTAADYVGITRVLSPVLGYWSSFINWLALALLVGIVPYMGVSLLGNFFTIAGALTHDSYYFDIATILTTNSMVILGISILVIVIAMLISLLGLRLYKIIMNLIFIIPLISMIIGLGVSAYYYMAGPAAVRSAWDSVFGSGAYQEIIDVAMANGWNEYVTNAAGTPSNFGFPGGWLWAPTLLAVISAAFSCWGYESAVFVAGEIKEARKSIPLGVIIAYILLTIFYVGSVYFVYSSYGKFLSMYAYVVNEGFTNQLQINVAAYPGWDLFVGVLTSSSFGPAMGLFAAIPGAWTNMAWCLVGLLLTSRVLFAWSFDRFAPEFLSRVNARFRTPHWSIFTVGVIGIAGAIYAVYNPYIAMLSVFSAAVLRYLFACWATMMFPYTRPDLFKMGFTWKIGRIPVATIIGAIGTAATTWLFVTFMVMIAGDWPSIIYQVVSLTIGIFVYAIFYAYNKTRGVDVEALWREIPPA